MTRRAWAARLDQAAWAYLLALLAAWLTMYAGGDRWWPATMLLFGPRWTAMLPLAVLLPATALRGRRRGLLVLAAAAVVAIGPVAGVRIPWRRLIPAGAPAYSLRVLTCNCAGSLLRAGDLRELIARVRPDVVVLQEHRFTGDAEARWRSEGWETRYGERICLLSRLPIVSYERLGRSDLDGQAVVARHELLTPIGGLQLFGLQLTSPRDGLEAVRYGGWGGGAALQSNIERRAAVAEKAGSWIARFGGPLLVAGDFNMTSDGAIYRRCFSGYANAFDDAGLGIGNTRFIPRLGFRVDHVLGGPGWSCRSCWVGPDVGSDHRPLIADWDWFEGDD